MNLEPVDYRLLDVLQQDGRITNKQLAETISMSAPACWRRLRALEDGGVIQAYTAIVDRKSVGLDLVGLARVALEHHDQKDVDSFETAVQEWPEVMECYKTSGNSDYILKVVIADLEAYDRFLSTRLLRMPMISSVNTSFAMREVKRIHRLPLHADGRHLATPGTDR